MWEDEAEPVYERATLMSTKHAAVKENQNQNPRHLGETEDARHTLHADAKEQKISVWYFWFSSGKSFMIRSQKEADTEEATKGGEHAAVKDNLQQKAMK